MGSSVNDRMRTSPRTPCGAPIWATQTRAPRSNPSPPGRRTVIFISASRRSRAGGSAFLRLLLRLGLLRVVALLALQHPGLVQEAQHTVRRCCPLGEPRLDLVE